MTGNWTWISPHDVWMFRDSKPFSAGQNFYMQSQFPPNPQVIYGVLRSHYLEANGVSFKSYNEGKAQAAMQAIGTATAPGELRVTGPFVSHRDASGRLQRYFPLPLDVLDGRVMQPMKAHNWASNMPEGWCPLGLPNSDKVPGKSKDNLWLSETALEAYLKGQPFNVTPEQDLFVFDERVGLGIDHKRRTNKQGLFYRARFVRPNEGVGLLVHTNMEVFKGAEGLVGIGGESRTGHYQVVNYALPAAKAEGRVKVILLTPAYFTDGWLPLDADWSAWLGNSAKLVSYSVGKPLVISGWDIARKAPKPLRHFLPAGSVFYFEDAAWQDKAFTEDAANAPYSVMGFGAAAVGTWNYL